MKKIVLAAIRLYQKTFSPDHGITAKLFGEGFCRYKPTCSQYTYEAINSHGVILGSFAGLWRVLRCNPWSKGGVDEVGSRAETVRKAAMGAGGLVIIMVILLLVAKILSQL